ncbi:MAG: DUF1592 domain-containing protein [Deltaproteobacteria bacterium]|nr:DUF1592 domain-containing protein [Deltaproteobacteria bacterium]
MSSLFRRARPAAYATWFAVLSLAAQGCSASAGTSDGDTDDGEGGQSGGSGGGGEGGIVVPPPPPGCDAVEPLAPTARRLTQSEVINSVRDVLGVVLTPQTAGFEKETITGFSTDVVALIPNFEFVRSSVTLGEKVTAKLTDRAAFVQKFGGCNEYGEACETKFVKGLGLRLFRRPLADEEVARFRKILADANQQKMPFAEGTSYVLQAMLGSASFLYRMEPEVGDGSFRQLDDYQIASRLSFALWATSPDDELMNKAREGKLKNASEREAQVERMLNDNRAKEVFARYASDWLVLEQAGKILYDEKMYPEYTPALGAQIVEETKAFIDAFWDEGLPHNEIYTAKFAFADKKMAEIYGFENPKEGLTRYDLSKDPHRFGLLTQAAILGPSGVRSTEPGIVFRGQFILKRFMCTEPPELTQELRESLGDRIAENLQVGESKSQRFAAEARNSGGTCAACHSTFDPLAYALEPYDSLGRHREQDRFGNKLRTDGKFTSSLDSEERSFATTEEFATTFAQLPQTRACLVANALHFLAGQAIHIDDEKQGCLVESIKNSMSKPDASFKDLFRAIALHPANQGFKTLAAP